MAFTKATFDYLDSEGLIKWITTAKTTNFTAVSGEGYLVDTITAAVTVTLPTTPSAGDEIIIVDYASNAGTNNITIDPGTLNLRGATDDLVLSTNNQSTRLLYSGATKGWLVTTEAGGGTATASNLTVDYLVVAGGGGSGHYAGAGGGGGGLRTSYGSISPITLNGGSMESYLTLESGTNYTVTIGGGGASSPVTTNQNQGGIGSNSVFSTITSTGGGGGGGASSGGSSGGNGGSGGGSNGYGSATASGGNAVTTPVIQGHKGGDSTLTSNIASGAGGAGAAASNNNKNGGIGLAVNILNNTNAGTASVGEISSSNVYYAGGGGSWDYGIGGLGGGGDANVATSGEPNTGGGAGGDVSGQSGSFHQGNSGVVILRYPSGYNITVGSGITQASGSPFTEGTDKVSVFTAGTGSITFGAA